MAQLKPRIILEPLSIQVEGPDRYRLCFSSDNGEVEYMFEVHTKSIPVVTWEDRFRDDMGGLLDPATPLFESILAFHEARKTMTQGPSRDSSSD